jgi:hypothetical protein
MHLLGSWRVLSPGPLVGVKARWPRLSWPPCKGAGNKRPCFCMVRPQWTRMALGRRQWRNHETQPPWSVHNLQREKLAPSASQQDFAVKASSRPSEQDRLYSAPLPVVSPRERGHRMKKMVDVVAVYPYLTSDARSLYGSWTHHLPHPSPHPDPTPDTAGVAACDKHTGWACPTWPADLTRRRWGPALPRGDHCRH